MVDQKYQGELTEFNAVEAGIAALVEKANNLPSVETPDGYKQHKALAKDLTKRRTTTDKLRLELTQPHRDFVKEVNERGNGIIDRIKLIEEPVKERIKDVDEREQRERERRHAELREKIADRITGLEGRGSNSGEIADVLEQVERLDMTGYYDLSNEALDEQARVKRALQDRFDRVVQEESLAAERAALAKERAEIEAWRREKERAQEPGKSSNAYAGPSTTAVDDQSAPEPAFDIPASFDLGAGETVDHAMDARQVCRLLVDAFDGGDLTPDYLEYIVGEARKAAAC